MKYWVSSNAAIKCSNNAVITCRKKVHRLQKLLTNVKILPILPSRNYWAVQPFKITQNAEHSHTERNMAGEERTSNMLCRQLELLGCLFSDFLQNFKRWTSQLYLQNCYMDAKEMHLSRVSSLQEDLLQNDLAKHNNTNKLGLVESKNLLGETELRFEKWHISTPSGSAPKYLKKSAYHNLEFWQEQSL